MASAEVATEPAATEEATDDVVITVDVITAEAGGAASAVAAAPALAAAGAAAAVAEARGDGLDGLDRDLEMLVDALVRAEQGSGADDELLPHVIVCWFLDHARRFRWSAAHAALALMERVAEHGDEEQRARVAEALAPFADLDPERVERALWRIADRGGAGAGAAVTAALMVLLSSSEEPDLLVERWIDGSPAQRELVGRARRLLAAKGEVLAG